MIEKEKKRKHCSSSPLANSRRNQNCHCLSSTTAFSSGSSANHSSRPTTTEKTTTSAHRSTPIYYLRHRLAAPPQQTFGFSNQTSVTNHQPQPPTNPPQPAPTLDQQIFIYHRPQCHRLQQRQRIHASTGPRPAATPQTLSLHRRSQAKSQSHVSCAIAVSSDNRL